MADDAMAPVREPNCASAGALAMRPASSPSAADIDACVSTPAPRGHRPSERGGFDVRLKAVVGDDVTELTALLTDAMVWADVVVLTGGLGPTEDDITREALARALDAPLEMHEHIAERIRERFGRRGRVMPEINRRQALVPRGATLLDNPNGTAPGLWMEQGSAAIMALPGHAAR
jgi:molybdopterin-biosynthesis enzyme MoeA-like protein